MAIKSGSWRAVSRRIIGRRRRRDERAGVVVEFALISPLLFFLLAALIDYSLMFNDYQSLRSGVREGARSGAVLRFGDQNNCTLAPMVVEPSNDMRSLMCSTKKSIGVDHSRTRVRIMFADPLMVGGPDLAVGPAYSAGNALIVCSMTEQRSTTGMLQGYFQNKQLKTRTAMRIEQTSPTIQSEGYEAPLAGGDWNWCSNPSQVSP